LLIIIFLLFTENRSIAPEKECRALYDLHSNDVNLSKRFDRSPLERYLSNRRCQNMFRNMFRESKSNH
jgi:hypothetical protein